MLRSKSNPLALFGLALLLQLMWSPALKAQEPAPARIAETIRATLADAHFALTSDPAAARQGVEAARAAYSGAFAERLAQVASAENKRVQTGFVDLDQALADGDPRRFAAARGQIWTALLSGSYQIVEQAVQASDGRTAERWLQVREFRPATRFSRPGAHATLAVDALIDGARTPAAALDAVRADLLDTYQARLVETLHDLREADARAFATRRVEHASLAQGYWTILEPAYLAQHDATAQATVRQAFAALTEAAWTGDNLATPLATIEAVLHDFRAAPLSAEEQVRRSGQMLRFLELVPVEYGRGVSNGRVTRDLEIREATTFRDGAAAAFADLESLLNQRDTERTSQVAELLVALEQDLMAAGQQTTVADPSVITDKTRQIVALLREVMPAEWLKRDVAGDFDVIASVLDQMEAAVTSGQYDQAESARLEAYAILETGPEARLIAFAPQTIPPIEDLFWYGQGDPKGLAGLIEARAPAATIKEARAALDRELATAQGSLRQTGAPMAVATNALIIVFREGLEAVLILASLLGSLKGGPNRAMRRPLWWGAAAAFAATALTWVLMSSVLAGLARYGERLEAVVSLIAIAVLLLITNWFFHKVYWTGWMANFHTRKKRIIGGAAGLSLGMALLGFTSIYREGFETVLFLQALVLEAGTAVVLGGVALGLAATFLVGVLVFALQTKLPHKKMLIVTGIMIGVVLLVMVGNTVHVLQLVGWLPLHPIRTLRLPFWSSLWFGVWPTWEGLLLQAAAGIFVIGSYFAAEHLQHRRSSSKSAAQTNQTSAATRRGLKV